ncbi:putative two-component system sensor kinase [Streptantibioticus cattleyicolor NRRL 8057 = DSM 46488]|uniref:histidine kinase n=1 Tax=Streptantibioticus cattleyicolor (strain ATCC 35852 / DSM 46488 / JCM 4925 / NBRC 14057 / NRRL 8057) TaxID=1003195 RepID=F8JYL9_STREN|nr:putative two-component system sensor kinase [Streptantibioticus cattleyicolor NRRL 8057 = DSM 46488]MYS61693.1 two-component sensor histidine kinase [Streptomyces sp. SID5468]CCB77561.1 putative two-component system sensor kinase [Streptantibioticus cattleyicolor NRRL 8057 = DSM 46488]
MTVDDGVGMGPLVAWLGQVSRRLRHVDRARPWALDTAVVVLVFLVLCVPDLVRGSVVYCDDSRWRQVVFAQCSRAGILAFHAGLLLPLFWWRRRPGVAFGAVMAVFLLQWSRNVVLRADVALCVALFSVALHGRPRELPVVCAALTGGMVLVALRVSGVVPVWHALFFLLSTATAPLALGLAVRIRRAQLAGLRERAVQLEIERDQRSRLAAATERARVAREMHDIVGHNLSVVITLADAGSYATDLDPARGKEALQLIADTGRQALGELRRVLGVLREDGPRREPELSPQPGIRDIETLCAGLRAAELDVVHRTAGDVDALDRGVQLTVYRIAQEALTNTLKHAGPKARVDLAILVEETRLTVRVQDTGGPGRPGPPNEEGHGLVGMRERAALYGGNVSAGRTADGGWQMEAVLDLAPRDGGR